MMLRSHELLLEQYKQSERRINRVKTKTVIIEFLLVVIVCSLKVMQNIASLKLNVAATTCVSLLLMLHFWDFRRSRALERQMTEILIEGVEYEKRNPFSQKAFFHDYLKGFNFLAKIAWTALMDFAFLYFFSVSVTQLLKKTNPEIIQKLAFYTKFRTWIISFALIWAYYQPYKSLARLQKTKEGSLTP